MIAACAPIRICQQVMSGPKMLTTQNAGIALGIAEDFLAVI
ncbi:hypothetical protein Daudx_2145 [Candidatus Desulforudis audaxviator]|nr:hypothetical protein Daudx_2145 [Candidatus Desulforudis audaxviator]